MRSWLRCWTEEHLMRSMIELLKTSTAAASNTTATTTTRTTTTTTTTVSTTTTITTTANITTMQHASLSPKRALKRVTAFSSKSHAHCKQAPRLLRNCAKFCCNVYHSLTSIKKAGITKLNQPAITWHLSSEKPTHH